jgi:hypothetical protein
MPPFFEGDFWCIRYLQRSTINDTVESVLHKTLSATSAIAFPNDRRNRRRLAVHWPVRLFGQIGRKSLESTTENLSSEGFYCISRIEFKTGERLRCQIIMSAATLGLDTPIVLECRVTIRRVEHLERCFGLGCHIEDYSVGDSS